MKKNKKTILKNLGLIDYKKAWDYQTKYFEEIISVKLNNRTRKQKGEELLPTPNYLIFCEHPHVYTLGKSGKQSNLLASEMSLKNRNISYYQINRGGDITYHGPGQIVIYPIIDLDNFFTDIHFYLRLLETVVICTLKHYGVIGGRIDKLTGVWINFHGKFPRKICAIGIKTSRWVAMHGLALNINTDLNYFKSIIPCGIIDKSVTSLQEELKSPQNMNEVERLLQNYFSQLFEMELITESKAV